MVTKEKKVFNAIFSGKKIYQKSTSSEDLRQIFNREKIRLICAIKDGAASSIYGLAKYLDRNFRSVYDDLKVLEQLDIVSFKKQYNGKKELLVPVLNCSEVQINVKF